MYFLYLLVYVHTLVEEYSNAQHTICMGLFDCIVKVISMRISRPDPFNSDLSTSYDISSITVFVTVGQSVRIMLVQFKQIF